MIFRTGFVSLDQTYCLFRLIIIQLIQMDFFGKRPIFETIADYYRKLIALGALKPGDPLPSVREVAVGEGVNPNTVARAFSLLCDEGLIVSVPKKGYFVTAGKVEHPKEPLVKALHDLLSQGYSKEEIQNALKEMEEDL